jgi:anti-sigma B factor antagonist
VTKMDSRQDSQVAVHSAGAKLEVERGPDWIFIRPVVSEDGWLDTPALAEAVWTILEQNMIYRVVLELDQVDALCSDEAEQLCMLAERVHAQGGLARVCGLSARNRAMLDARGPKGMFPNYRDRSEAVMCSRPTQPR